MKNSHQRIECGVKSCAHNVEGCACDLSAISVKPCAGGSTGNPQDESMCNSYEAQNWK